jgi:sugar O-acyltransferase (sialic acid O-acetyltransferase NeuD family)
VTRLLILGAGTFAVDVFEAAVAGGRFDPVGFVVSDAAFIQSRESCGLPVTDLASLTWAPGDVVCLAGITSPRRRAFCDDVRARGFTFATVIHPSAIVARSATFGTGAFVGAGAIIGANGRIAADVIVNRGANLGHDAEIGPGATIGPGAVLAGCVTVGAGAVIGVGAVVADHLSVGRDAMVAAGAVVVKAVAERMLVAGSPARALRSTDE